MEGGKDGRMSGNSLPLFPSASEAEGLEVAIAKRSFTQTAEVYLISWLYAKS